MHQKIVKPALELKVVLEQSSALLDELLEIMHGERELLVRFQPEKLLEQNKRKELLVLQHGYLEQNRRGLSDRLARLLGIPEEDASLETLVEVLEGELAHALGELRLRLTAQVEAIRELNDINGRLIEFSIKSVKGSVAFLKRRFFNSETYSATGVINHEIDQLSSLNSRA